MKSLYRKYRPLKLADVVGQKQVTEPLINSLKQGKISHAYLFIGPRGCGKTSVARILAHEVNNFDYKVEDEYVDIIEIDGASNRGIDNIRELREKVAIAPTKGKYKVYIIDEVHMLTKEAFNALLKTLEEPPEHAIFIMATTDAYKVPVTITSRAQTYTFKLADTTVMLEFLKSIVKKEKIPIDDDALEIIAKRGGGSFRDSLSLLDQISTLSKERITKDLVISALGLPSSDEINSLLESCISGNLAGITSAIKNLLSSGIKPETVAEEIITSIIENPRPETLSLLQKLPDVRAPFAEAKLIVALMPETPIAAKIPISPAPVQSIVKKEVVVKKTEIPNPVTGANFDWVNYLDKVRELNDAIYAQLLKTKHQFRNNCLHIYPERRIVGTILSRDNNKKILVETAGDNVKITIHDAGELPESEANDDVLQKISAIMGGEVRNDGGENPFRK